ncbi:hypothetical protein [Oleidesulfovibrio sp.]|uniref:hypothetical protein n=1 Tax=Oleidesulfovibrio sp. TaxID=2909707 RepID=UPI003A8561E8
MPNDELSAKVAVLRGELAWRRHLRTGLLVLRPSGEVSKAWIEPEGGEKISAGAYDKVKQYAEDMNAALELIREMQAAGLRVDVIFAAENNEPYEDRWVFVEIWTVARQNLSGIMVTTNEELLIEHSECSWFHPATVISKAYIEWKTGCVS